MLGLILTASLLPALPLQADEVDRELQSQVRSLVRLLDDDDLSTREEAEEDLKKLGAKVLPLLPEIDDNTPAEVKQRLGRVRKVLEVRQAAQAAESSLVTLSGEMKLSEIMAAILKQTGNKIVDSRQQFGQQGEDVTIKTDFKDEKFWSVIDQVLDRADLTVYGYGGDGDLALVAKDTNALPRVGRATYNGLFRIEATRVDAVRDLRSPDESSLTLSIEVAWEPRTRPIAIELAFEGLEAIGDTDEPIEIASRQTQLDVAVESNVTATELRIPLSLPSKDIESLKSISGQLSALVQVSQKNSSSRA